ncbi:TIM barrel protein [Spirosoma agri]|uniref:TIM barrel protein n=1 Tax=Spirosoma agri TaxID=1987381 RepID=A0A6M0IPX6_9BACT|nr:TIM barrel protein [Spirosoma agri]NEU70094.1 TIM barrel protein [Spirosoma agri]
MSALTLDNPRPFKTLFSPEFGIFKGLAPPDPIDEIKWGYDQGFRAWENTFLKNRPVAEQERISKTVQKLNMAFGQFVGTLTFTDVTFAGRDARLRESVLADVRASVEIAKRMNTRIIHNVLGVSDPKLPWDFQMANAIDLLKRIADIYEPHGLVMVMESMNHRVDHPTMFLHTIPQAYALAKAVGRPSVKVLFDFYHVQVQEGHLLTTLDYAWDEIAYIQIGDSPGRFEPTTGEMNYPNIIKHLHDKGYKGFVGLEHGLSKPGREGAQAALNAYRTIDIQ